MYNDSEVETQNARLSREESRLKRKLLPMKYSTITNPYDPRKILAHPAKLQQILDGENTPHPVTIEVDLVDGVCNSRCYHCCFKKYGVKPDFLKTKPLFRSLKIASNKGVKAIELVGGTEPTMHPEIESIAKTIKSYGLEIGLITNGILLEKIFKVASLFTFIRISLDAGSRKTYRDVHGIDCFQKVTDNINQMANNYLDPKKIGIAYLCVPGNCDKKEIEETVQFAINKKVGYLVFRPAILPRNWKPDYLDSVGESVQSIRRKYGKKINIFSSVAGRWQTSRNQKRSERDSCYTNSLTGVIMANGNVPFCNLYRGHENFSLGNIYSRTFSEIWESDRKKKMQKEIDISSCPVPCKADDYRKILIEFKEGHHYSGISCSLPVVSVSAHRNFV